MEKKCFECKQYKPHTEFQKDRSKKDGLCPYCKICRSMRDGTDPDRSLVKRREMFAKGFLRCSLCKKFKTLDNFHNCKTFKYGKVSQCKKCMEELRKEQHKTPEYKEKRREYRNRPEVRERDRELHRKWVARQDPEKYKARKRRNSKARHARLKNDPDYKAARQLRSMLKNSLKRDGHVKRHRSEELLQCDLETARRHLESGKYKFTDKGIHIDHVIPLEIGRTYEEKKLLCHYLNLQLLPGRENIIKGMKLPSIFELNPGIPQELFEIFLREV